MKAYFCVLKGHAKKRGNSGSKYIQIYSDVRTIVMEQEQSGATYFQCHCKLCISSRSLSLRFFKTLSNTWIIEFKSVLCELEYVIK